MLILYLTLHIVPIILDVKAFRVFFHSVSLSSYLQINVTVLYFKISRIVHAGTSVLVVEGIILNPNCAYQMNCVHHIHLKFSWNIFDINVKLHLK
jgi:hypothetical protein